MPNMKMESLLLFIVGLVCISACSNQNPYLCPIDVNVLQTFGLHECMPQNLQEIGPKFERGYLILRKNDCPSTYVCARYTKNDTAFVLISTPLANNDIQVSDCAAKIEEDCRDSSNCTIYWKRQSLPDHLRSNKCDFNSWLLQKMEEVEMSKEGVNNCRTNINFLDNSLIKIITCKNQTNENNGTEMGFHCLEMMNDGQNETRFLLQSQDSRSSLMTMRYNIEDRTAYLSEFVSSLDNAHFYSQYCYPTPYYNGELALFEPSSVIQYKLTDVNRKHWRLIDPSNINNSSLNTEIPKTSQKINTLHGTTTLTTSATTTVTTTATTKAPATKTTPIKETPVIECSFLQIYVQEKQQCVSSLKKLITTILIVFFILLVTLLTVCLLLLFCKREKKQLTCKDERRFRCLVTHAKC